MITSKCGCYWGVWTQEHVENVPKVALDHQLLYEVQEIGKNDITKLKNPLVKKFFWY